MFTFWSKKTGGYKRGELEAVYVQFEPPLLTDGDYHRLSDGYEAELAPNLAPWGGKVAFPIHFH